MERAAWALMVGGLALGLAGFFGGGPISSARTDGVEGGLSASLEYERFSRSHATDDLTLRVTAPAGVEEVRFALPQDWLEQADIDSITPQAEPQLAAGRTWFSVPVSKDGGSSVITIQYHPRNWGTLGADLNVVAGENSVTLHFDQMLAP